MMSVKRLFKFINILFVTTLAVSVFSGTTALAAQPNLPKGFIISDSTGVNVEADGKYSIHIDNIIPGEIIIKTITVHNLERSRIPFILSMMAEPENVSGPVNLLDAMTLTITMDGNTLYHGRLRGDEGPNMIQNALPLGIYASGDSKILHIRIQTGNWEPSEEKSIAEISWYFYAGKGHNACGFAHCWVYVLAAMICLAVLFLFLLRKKKMESNK